VAMFRALRINALVCTLTYVVCPTVKVLNDAVVAGVVRPKIHYSS